MANTLLEIARLGTPIKAAHVQFIALGELADLLRGIPILGRNPAIPEPQGSSDANPNRVEAIGHVSSTWMLASCSDLSAAIRGPIARIARSIRTDLADGGELVMMEQLRSKWPWDTWEHVSDPRRGLHMRLDYTDNVFIFSVLYWVRYTTKHPKLEWSDRPLAYSLAGAD